ncbi:hypothetical protein BDZ91DRAFT_791971 [Kalaharituber pfeilii]|nr:hypothetical protein BDZ91DRAFT_791971 [Kalaharituber pfeilii]
MDNTLLKILDSINEAKLTIKSFFLAVMVSEHHTIQTRVGLFFKDEGLEECLKAMINHTRFGPGKRKTERARQEAAARLGPIIMPFIEEILCDEIVSFSNHPIAKKPPNKIAAEDCLHFDFLKYHEALTETAPYLTTLMNKVCKLEEEDKDAQLEHEQREQRDKRIIITTAICCIAYAYLRSINSLQVMMGYYFQAERASKRSIATCNRMGICCSYNTIQASMTMMAKSSLIAVKQRIANGEAFGCAWDNAVVTSKRRAEETELNKGGLIQYTAGFIWILNIPKPKDPKFIKAYESLIKREESENGKILPGIRREILYKKPNYNEVTALDILDLDGLADYLPLRAKESIEWVLWKHFGEVLSESRINGHRVTKFVYNGGRLEPNQTEVYPLPTMDLDETTIDGTASIIEEIRRLAGVTSKEMLGRSMLHAGDQGTLMKVKSLKKMRIRDFIHNRLDDLFRVDGLFHVQMGVVDMMMRAHWGRKDGLDPASMCKFVTVLGRTRVTEEKTEYNAGKRFQECYWEGHVLAIIAKEMECQTYEELRNKLKDKETNWRKIIETVVDKIYPSRKVGYMRQTAIERATEKWKDILKKKPTERQGLELDKKRFLKTAEANERDIVYENACLLLQHGSIAWMLHQDIKNGDTNAILKDLEILTVMFNGCGKSHYAKAMLELAIDRKTWWTESMDYLWRCNAVLNISGKAGKYMGIDKVNELIVQKVKESYNPRGTFQSKWFHLEVLSPNVFMFRNIKKSITKTSGAVNYGSKHTSVDDRRDSMTIMEMLIRDNIVSFRKGRVVGSAVQPIEVQESLDLVAEGRDKILWGGSLGDILESRKVYMDSVQESEIAMEDSGMGGDTSEERLLDELEELVGLERDDEAWERWDGEVEYSNSNSDEE